MSEDTKTHHEMNTTTPAESVSRDLNESSIVAGIEMQSAVLEANESESIELPVNFVNEIGSLQNVCPSTSRDAEANSGESTRVESLDNSGDEGIGDIMDMPESSMTSNNKSPRPSMEIPLEGYQLIDLQPKIKVVVLDEFPLPPLYATSKTANAEGIDDDTDTLSPLMMDNHCYVEHCEMLRHNNKEILELHDISDDEFDVDDDLVDEEQDSVGTLIPPPQTYMKHSNINDSISSSDSDMALPFRSTKPIETISNMEQKMRQEHFIAEYRNNSMSDDAKDSGSDMRKSSSDDDQPVEIPDDDFCEQIVEQVEFYFSDDSLLKDAFLLKHVRRNKEGFVSLKLVSSFKRVRALTKDWRVVGIAIKRKSKKIELNDVETKIRRLEPLPLYDETTPSRTVVATNLPFDKLTIEKVSDIFSKCGEIALVRILRPNAPIPADVRQFVNKHPELQQNECALVEFTESSAARRAQRMDDIVVFELVLPKKKTGKKATNMTKMIENYKYNTESENERSRGGENLVNNNNNRFYLKRNNSGPNFITRPEYQTGFQHTPAPRKMSFNNESNSNIYTPPFSSFHPQQQYYEIPPRRLSNCSPLQTPNDRKYSNCSDSYSSCSDALSRRQSMCSDVQRRLSNCSDGLVHAPPSPQTRRSSVSCSEHQCTCGSRRMSQYSNDSFRRISNGSMSDYPRKFSSGSSNYGDRKYSTASTCNQSDGRRISFDTGFERKISSGSLNYERKYSNGFDPLRKLSQTSDYYVNGRKISTDSGYDRRLSINSISYDNENPIMRSRNNSINYANNHQSNEPLMRTPIGPDPEGKGFGFGIRTRKIGHINVNTAGTISS